MNRYFSAKILLLFLCLGQILARPAFALETPQEKEIAAAGGKAPKDIAPKVIKIKTFKKVGRPQGSWPVSIGVYTSLLAIVVAKSAILSLFQQRIYAGICANNFLVSIVALSLASLGRGEDDYEGPPFDESLVYLATSLYALFMTLPQQALFYRDGSGLPRADVSGSADSATTRSVPDAAPAA